MVRVCKGYHFNSLLLFLLIFSFTGFLNATEPDTIRIMPIGDSLTQCNEPGYRVFLYKMLTKSNLKFDFVGAKHDTVAEIEYDTDHSGFSGYTIGPGPSLLDEHDCYKQGNILFHLNKGHCILASKPDVILLMIGVNDFFNNRDTMRYNPDVVGAERLDNLIYHIYQLLPECTLLISNITPLRGYEQFASLYNKQVPDIVAKYSAHSYKCYFVDMRNMNWNLEKDLGPDNLHPTASGYQKIAANFYKTLKVVFHEKM